MLFIQWIITLCCFCTINAAFLFLFRIAFKICYSTAFCLSCFVTSFVLTLQLETCFLTESFPQQVMFSVLLQKKNKSSCTHDNNWNTVPAVWCSQNCCFFVSAQESSSRPTLTSHSFSAARCHFSWLKLIVQNIKACINNSRIIYTTYLIGHIVQHLSHQVCF